MHILYIRPCIIIIWWPNKNNQTPKRIRIQYNKCTIISVFNLLTPIVDIWNHLFEIVKSTYCLLVIKLVCAHNILNYILALFISFSNTHRFKVWIYSLDSPFAYAFCKTIRALKGVKGFLESSHIKLSVVIYLQ